MSKNFCGQKCGLIPNIVNWFVESDVGKFDKRWKEIKRSGNRTKLIVYPQFTSC